VLSVCPSVQQRQRRRRQLMCENGEMSHRQQQQQEGIHSMTTEIHLVALLELLHEFFEPTPRQPQQQTSEQLYQDPARDCCVQTKNKRLEQGQWNILGIQSEKMENNKKHTCRHRTNRVPHTNPPNEHVCLVLLIRLQYWQPIENLHWRNRS
jgi:hypothetical protein